MSVQKSVIAFLNNKGGVFNVPVNSDPIEALATAMRKDVRSIRAVVRSLQEADRIWVRPTAKGSLPPAIGMHSRSHGEDRRPVTAEGKRQDKYARGVPAFLPDSMVGELTVRKIDDLDGAADVEEDLEPAAEAVETTAVAVGSFTLRGRMPEFLTLALMALRRDSVECEDCASHDDFGGDHHRVDANSCTDLLVSLLTGLTKEQAANLNATLGKLGLRHSVTVGAGLFRHYVRVDVEEVTAEMLRPTPGEPAPEADDLEQFLVYVEGLEKQVAELKPLEGQVARQLAQITDLNAQIREKDGLIEDLRRQVGELEREAELAARLRGVLDRSKSRSR